MKGNVLIYPSVSWWGWLIKNATHAISNSVELCTYRLSFKLFISSISETLICRVQMFNELQICGIIQLWKDTRPHNQINLGCFSLWNCQIFSHTQSEKSYSLVWYICCFCINPSRQTHNIYFPIKSESVGIFEPTDDDLYNPNPVVALLDIDRLDKCGSIHELAETQNLTIILIPTVGCVYKGSIMNTKPDLSAKCQGSVF